MLNIYLTNLGKYNEGELIGEWVSLPATQDQLERVLYRIGISSEPDENGVFYEEYFITDYETNVDGLEVGEYDNLDDLNEIASQIEDLTDSDLIALQAFLEEGYDFNDALEAVQDGEYTIYYDCHDMTDVAYEVVEQCDYLHGIPENIANYFDYEAFGRDLSFEGTFIFIGSDCIEIHR